MKTCDDFDVFPSRARAGRNVDGTCPLRATCASSCCSRYGAEQLSLPGRERYVGRLES